MHALWQDVRYGLRMLAKNPGFTAIAVITLAVGIGANAAIFSVVDAVLLKPLPFSEPDRLVSVSGRDLRNGEKGRALSYPDFADLRAQTRTLESVAAFDQSNFTVTGNGEPQQLQGGIVSADLFTVLRASPIIGRVFVSADDQPGTRVVLLSHSIWKSRFGGDPNIQGKTIQLDERAYTIVGVMPPQFQFPVNAEPMDLWTTMAVEMVNLGGDKPMTEERGAHFLGAIGRLKAGVTLEQANADTGNIAAGLEKQFPDTDGHLSMAVQPQIEALVGDIRPVLLLVLGAVGILLLIACANSANLLLARAAGRQREMAIRSSLGAGGGRIVRQLLTESVLLSIGGGTLGLFLAVWGTRLLASLPSVQIPRLAGATVNSAALLFTLVVSICAGILFGLAPALHVLRFDLFQSLKESGRTATEGVGRSRIRSLLVISEVSLAVVLLIGASLLLESMVRLTRVPPGFDPHGVLVFNVSLPSVRYGKPEQSADFYAQLLERLRAMPGVKSASGVEPLPLSDDIIRTSFQIEGHPVPRSEEARTQFRTIGLNYFQTMRIPLLSGRDFTARDDRHAAPVVIINQTLARKFFPNEDPIGKHIKPGVSAAGPSLMREIVGVAGDVKHRNLWQQADPESYVPYDQVPLGTLYVTVRTEGDPLALLPAVREQVKVLDTELPVYGARPMEKYLADSVAQRKFTSLLCTVFAGAGLLLAIIGLFGVVSYSVEQRTQELGVRVAMGAEKADILQLVIGHGMGMTLVGIVFGLAGTLAISWLLKSQLFGISPTDPLTFLGVACLLSVVAFAACYIPARRASRVDPMVALRYE
jgi:putative ABC transport system permease protein